MSTRILVIEVQEYWRNLAVSALEAAGFTVRAQASYDEAFLVGIDDIDVIIIGGAALRPEIEKIVPAAVATRKPVIVLLTLLRPNELVYMFHNLGASDAYTKPFSSEAIVRIVEELMQRRQARDAYEQVSQDGV